MEVGWGFPLAAGLEAVLIVSISSLLTAVHGHTFASPRWAEQEIPTVPTDHILPIGTETYGVPGI